jgi:prepilin-type processing-associated H-X9-DG protein
VLRGDYRVNSGSKRPSDEPGPGLGTPPERHPWWSEPRTAESTQNGICFQRSQIRVAQITDGTTRTAMLGEKYLDPDRYFDGESGADDQCIYTGHDRDNNGYTDRGDEPMLPQPDRPGLGLGFYFGSPHPAGLNMAFCDGSVRHVSFDIDAGVWSLYGGRDDGWAD